MKTMLKSLIVKSLTKTVPLKPLRRLYIIYSALNFWLKYGDHKFPRIIAIEICSHCNRACSYCPNSKVPRPAKLIEESVLSHIIQRLHEIDYNGVVDFVFFSEAMLHPRLPEIIARVKKACPKAIPRICTNGDLLTTEKVNALIKSGLDRIYVMRHLPTPDGWRERIESLDKEFPGIFVRMDIEELERTDGLHDFGGLIQVKKHRGRLIIGGKARCRVHRHVAQIDINGDWVLCCVDYARTVSFGNLVSESFMEIWNKSFFKLIRNELEEGKARINTCKTCTCLVERVPTNLISVNE